MERDEQEEKEGQERKDIVEKKEDSIFYHPYKVYDFERKI